MGIRDFLGSISYVSHDCSVRPMPLYRVRIAVLSSLNLVCRVFTNALYWSPFRNILLIKYNRQMSPAQLCFLCNQLANTNAVPGSVLEIGCADGKTSLFLYKFMADTFSSSKEYIVVDTFAGFTKNDIKWEVNARSKHAGMYIAFKNNSHRRFRSMLKINDAAEMRSIKADIEKISLDSIGPVSFALIDVDLYKPTADALQKVYQYLSPGGIIIVDDCDKSNFYWDGAYQAYVEFITAKGVHSQVVHKKLGVIKRPMDG